MNFAAFLECNSSRATPSLRRTSKTHHTDNANPAGVHLSIRRSCSDIPGQLYNLFDATIPHGKNWISSISVASTVAVPVNANRKELAPTAVFSTLKS